MQIPSPSPPLPVHQAAADLESSRRYAYTSRASDDTLCSHRHTEEARGQPLRPPTAHRAESLPEGPGVQVPPAVLTLAVESLMGDLDVVLPLGREAVVGGIHGLGEHFGHGKV